jgi:protein-S-isoprenylcysteine O-methyltransferase Ste14
LAAPTAERSFVEKLGGEIQSERLQKLMTNFWVDKAGAMILVVQAVVSMVDAYHNQRGLEMILWLVSQTLMVGFAVFRTTPKRVTTNPVYWLIELMAFGSWFLYWTVRTEAAPAVAPEWLTAAIAVLGLAILIGARLSLARSFGYLPAQREIRVVGMYAVIRHPLYVAILLNGIALLLHHFSVMMIIAVLINNFFFLLKALIEENYLALHSPEYRAYLQRVRWRYIPYVF